MTCAIAGISVFATDAMAQDSAANGGAAYGTPTADTRAATQQAAPTPPPAPGEVGAATPAPPAPVPGSVATIDASGLAAPPVNAPPAVQNAIIAANAIVGKPYKYGGGHRPGFLDPRGYDCSGTVSFALNGGGLIEDPLDSSGFFSWGDKGPGAWITVYTKSSHAFMVIAGLRLDTSAAGDPSGAKGPRWRPVLRSTRGFKARHPVGL
jgi:hypothetical protein